MVWCDVCVCKCMCDSCVCSVSLLRLQRAGCGFHSVLTSLPPGSQMMGWPFHLGQDCSVTHSMKWKLISLLNTSHRSPLCSLHHLHLIWILPHKKGQNPIFSGYIIFPIFIVRTFSLEAVMYSHHVLLEEISFHSSSHNSVSFNETNKGKYCTVCKYIDVWRCYNECYFCNTCVFVLRRC